MRKLIFCNIWNFSISITPSNRIAIVYHDVPNKSSNNQGTHSNSKKLKGCDNLDNDELKKSQLKINRPRTFHDIKNSNSSMFDATNKKSIDEDDEDSGVELGSFLPSDQDDNTSSSSGKPGFCLSM